ncbi:MAG: hypothetical protein ABIP43_08135 [Nitrospiraceae bacterium]
MAGRSEKVQRDGLYRERRVGVNTIKKYIGFYEAKKCQAEQ